MKQQRQRATRSAQSHKPFNIILLGDPASGKGTQADTFAKRYGLYDLDMGKEVKKPAALRKYDYKSTVAMGKLAPTAVVRDILRHAVTAVPHSQGILFNGTPKMINEAHLVANLLAKQKRADPLVIYLHIPMREMVQRMKLRRERVNGKLVKRDDDSMAALVNRKRYYKTQIVHVVDFFRSRYAFRRVSGLGTREEVEARIGGIIKEFKETHDERGSK